jgi:hypothetical protein
LVSRTIGVKKAKISTFRTIGTVLCGMSTVTVPAVMRQPKFSTVALRVAPAKSNDQASTSSHRGKRGHLAFNQ